MTGLERTEPDLSESLDPLWRRIRRTIAWCRPKVLLRQPGSCLRTATTRPRHFEPTYFSTVQGVDASRHGVDEGSVPADSLEGGRLLVYFPDLDLADGAAEVESGGYFDVNNAPPWDTWIAMVLDAGDNAKSPYLVSWVPQEFLGAAQRGIDVNPEQCILWIEDADVHLWQVQDNAIGRRRITWR
jgi:hypothetical protein